MVASLAVTATKPIQKQEVVVLIHGLMRTSWSMSSLRRHLEHQGYKVYSYNYLSARYTIQEHSASLNQFIKQLLTEHPGAKLSFITHSMGGIIARDALAKLPTNQLKQIGSLIMLAPPNQGSELAKVSLHMAPIISYFIKPLAQLSSESTAYIHHVPIPKVKMGIIAGRFDAKVPPSSARLDDKEELVIVNSTHTFIMTNSQTKKLVSQFLKCGSFTQC